MDTIARHYEDILVTLDALSEQTGSSAAVTRAREIAAQARSEGEEGYALFFEGEAKCREGNLKEGARLEEEAAKNLPEVPFVLINLAVVLSVQRKVWEALKHLDRALALEPENSAALAQKAVCLSKVGLDEGAVVYFDKILAADPTNTHALRNKGVSLSRLGREQEALVYLERALEINPQDTHALSERKILRDEIRLKGTPLGWLLIWIRKKLIPFFRRLFRRYA